MRGLKIVWYFIKNAFCNWKNLTKDRFRKYREKLNEEKPKKFSELLKNYTKNVETKIFSLIIRILVLLWLLLIIFTWFLL